MKKNFEMKVATIEKPNFSVAELIQKTAQWGKDHWSLLAYFETVCVDNQGRPDFMRMRINPKMHPFGGGTHFGPRQWQDSYATRLKDGSIPNNKHDDYDVMEELENLGFLENIGTGINPVIKLTFYKHQTVTANRL